MESLQQANLSSGQSSVNPENKYITDVHLNYEPTDEDLFISAKSGDY